MEVRKRSVSKREILSQNVFAPTAGTGVGTAEQQAEYDALLHEMEVDYIHRQGWGEGMGGGDGGTEGRRDGGTEGRRDGGREQAECKALLHEMEVDHTWI
jgi:hypothetical protein